MLTSGTSTKLLRGLANALAREDSYLEACQRKEDVLAHVDYESCSDAASRRNDRIIMAEWYCKLKLPRKAIYCLSTALQVDPEFHEGRYKLLQVLFDCKDMQEAAKVLCDLAKDLVEPGKPGKLGLMIESMVHDADQIKNEKMFGRFFSIVFLDDHDLLLESTLREMDATIARAREQNNIFDLSALLLYKGVAIHHYPNVQAFGGDLKESAVDVWRQSVNSDVGWPSRRATVLMSAYHFERAKGAKGFPDQTQYLQELTAATKTGLSYGLSTARAYLAGFFARVVLQTSSVREAVQADIVVAFDMLSDDTDTNDWFGYYDLGVILMHCGDMPNALAALSLCRPPADNTKVIAGLLHSDAALKGSLGRDIPTDLSESRIRIDELIEEVKNRRLSLAASSAHNMPNTGYEKIREMVDRMPKDKEGTGYTGPL